MNLEEISCELDSSCIGLCSMELVISTFSQDKVAYEGV
jgi:hypothetical protein